MKTGTAAALLVVAIGSLGACASSTTADGLNAVNELAARIGGVEKSIDLAKARVDAAVAAVDAIGRFDFKDNATTAYSQFAEAVDDSVQQVAELRTSIAAMNEVATPLFKQWEEHLSTFAGDEMRKLSEARRNEMRARYDAILVATDGCLAACDAFNQRLSDHIAYLRFDFNADSLAVIQSEVAGLTQAANILGTQFKRCQDAARDYVNTAALPKAGASAKPEAEPRAGGS